MSAVAATYLSRDSDDNLILSFCWRFTLANSPFSSSKQTMSTKAVLKSGAEAGSDIVGYSRKRKAIASARDGPTRRRKLPKGDKRSEAQGAVTNQKSPQEDAIPAAKLRADRKAERRDVLNRAREKWEELRPKATAKDKSVKLCDELYSDLKGRIREFAFRPDGSRIIQWLLASSSPSTRSAVLAELLDTPNNAETKNSGQNEQSNISFFAKLLTDRYGKHLAVKLLRIVPVSKRTEMVEKEIIPHVSLLLRTIPGANALDVAYTTILNGPSRSQIVLASLFSSQPAHWPQVQRTLVDASAKSTANSGKSSVFNKAMECVPKEFRQVVLDSACETATRLVEKEELLSLEIVHAVLREWLDVAMMDNRVEDVRTLASALASQLGRLCHTRAGMLVSLTTIKVLDAKHRKKAARSLTGLLRKVVVDEFGHRVILGLMEWTDDTRLIGQLLVGELFKSDAGVKIAPSSNVKDGAEGGVTDGRSGGGIERKRGGRSKAEKKGKPMKKEPSKSLDKSNEGSFDMDFMIELCKHKFGRTVLLHVMFGHDSRYFHPEGYGIVWEGVDEDKFGKTSKKDEQVRRSELFGYLEEGIKTVVLQHACTLLENVQASPIMIGAATHGGARDAVTQALTEIFEADRLEEICKSASARRALGAIFKVSKEVAAAVFKALGPDAVRMLAITDNGMSIAKHLADSCGDVKAVEFLNQFNSAATGEE